MLNYEKRTKRIHQIGIKHMNLELLTTDIYNSIACYLDSLNRKECKPFVLENIKEQCEKHWNIHQKELALDAQFNDTYRD